MTLAKSEQKKAPYKGDDPGASSINLKSSFKSKGDLQREDYGDTTIEPSPDVTGKASVGIIVRVTDVQEAEPTEELQ